MKRTFTFAFLYIINLFSFYLQHFFFFFRCQKKTIINTTTSILLHMHVRPNAKINAIREINSNNEIGIDIAADAQDGKANYELIDYIKNSRKSIRNYS